MKTIGLLGGMSWSSTLLIRIPLLHIAEATAQKIKEAGLTRVGLLGTKYTMEQDFFKQKLASCGIETLVPDVAQRDEIHRIIFEELCTGKIIASSRERMLAAINGLLDAGAEGIIFGCTEISLPVSPEDCPFPLFDTLAIHVDSAIEHALAQPE